MTKKGITGNQSDYNIPLTIDAQYVVGFTWTREPQFRVTKSYLNDKLWLALSLENPQTNYGIGPAGAVPSTVGSVNYNNPGAGGLPSTTNYTTEVAPDIIGKVAYDFNVAHLEAYGLGRFLHDRITYPTDTASSKTVTGGAGGAAAYIHMIPKYLDLQASFLAGTAVGRYGSAQLPDATIGPDGAPKPLSEYAVLVGLIGHPLLNTDLYAYGGREEVDNSYFNAHSSKGVTPYGYGNPLYPNTTCDVVLGSSTGCVGNTSAITQGTIGGWWKFLHSKEYGSMQMGLQYSYTHREIFQGLGPTPKTDENMIFFSFRYYPFNDTAPNAPPAL